MTINRRNQRRAARQSIGMRSPRETSVPLPTGGLFVEADDAEMAPKYASQMLNWRSTGVSIEMRPQLILEAATDDILQRLPFEFAPTRQIIQLRRLQAAAFDENGTQIAARIRRFDGKASAATISGNTIIADGLDHPLRYDGTTFTLGSFTTDTGIAARTFNRVLAHHDRLYFWKNDGPLEFYYGDVGAVTGTLTRFPLSRLGTITGSIAEMASMTIDAGHGMNDVLCILTTTGELVVYEGLDPGDSLDWRLSARIKVAPPVSPFVFTQVGGDLWMLSASGLVSINMAIRQGQLALISQVTRPISDDLVKKAEAGTGDWQLHTAADAGMVLVNYIENNVAEQWIYYNESNTWAKADYPAKWWYNFGRETRLVTVGGQAGTLRRSPDADEEITATWVSGWIRLPVKAGLRTITPTIIASGPLTVSITVLTDHDTTGVDISEAEQTKTVEPDNPGDKVSLNEPFAVDAVGSVFQIRMTVTAKWAKLVNLTAS